MNFEINVLFLDYVEISKKIWIVFKVFFFSINFNNF